MDSFDGYTPASDDPGTDAAAAAAPPEPRTAGFHFTGTTDEYFRIWIVNACLSIVTLGIYSAWAKVRMTKYVRGHTLVDGVPFTYDANPIAILKGRLIAVGAFGLWTGLGYISPVAQLALLVPAAFIVPWLVVASLRFNARVTAYRNVGFRFDGDYKGALKYFVGFMLLAGCTGYIMLPWAIRQQRAWQARHTSWGNRRLELRALTSEFYAAYMPMFIAVVILIFVMFFMFSVAAVTGGKGDEGSATDTAMSTGMIVGFAITYLVIILAAFWTQAALVGTTLGGLAVGDQSRMRCSIASSRYAWILGSNALVSLVTLGMMYPWGEVRRLRYLASHTTIGGAETFDTVVGPRGGPASAAGDEVADAFDIDVGF
jgi:uncharacterized membrane protein YjgN (DUF898 family)